MKKLIGALCFTVLILNAYGQTKYTISGYVTDDLGEELIGASVLLNNQLRGTVTNTYGFYSLTLEEGTHELEVSFLGYEVQTVNIKLTENKRLNFSLKESAELIESVEIYAKGRDINIREVEMSTNTLQMKTIQKLPLLLGETDIIKTVQLLPGVLSASEASGGFHVRGGGVDQNLILLDHAPVYNASHAVGFFSVFNADAIKDLKLYKGGIPAEYGGRLSSILDIYMKEGNKTEFHGSGGIGTLSSRLTVEGPVVKEKVSFLVSGRRTYFDVLFLPFSQDSMARESDIYFYDLNAKINYTINDNNRVFLSGYFGRDVFRMGDMFDMDYGNFTVTARWNHVFNNRLFLNVSTIYSNYLYDLGVEEDLTTFNWKMTIKDLNQHLDFTYYLNPNNTVKFGLQGIFHNFNPAEVTGKFVSDTLTEYEIPINYSIPNIFALEYGIYLSNEHTITSNLTLLYGLRYSLFQNIGGGQSIMFDRSDPVTYIVLDTLHYSRGEIFNTFAYGLEPRLSVRYTLNSISSVKASYNRMFQYIHLASNSTASLPLDFWFPSSPNIKPQIVDQVALGYFRNFFNNQFETSVEVFYKWYKNSIDFKDHAELLLNDEYEGQLRIGTARSYGAEFMIRKQQGKLTGWVSYTYARTFKKIPEIYEGKEYPASYDKPHDLAVIVSYDLFERWNFSANWIYTSAPPRTLPSQRFNYGGMIAPYYSDRNSIRIFPYHRLDISATFRLNKVKKNFEQYLNLSVYNVYMRKNPVMLSFREDPDQPDVTKAYMIYLYRIVPSITYTFKF
ncbi:MAG: TonB-dependent receptor [Bacteroidales bacterium]|nr:TonB-dependent receptor [Bacteroidales bacterium]